MRILTISAQLPRHLPLQPLWHWLKCRKLPRCLQLWHPMLSIFLLPRKPSGRFLSPSNNPVGSLIEGISARLSARQMRSFNCWWQVDLPALRLQDRQCRPRASTLAPQGQVCGSQMLSPKLRPTTTLMGSFPTLVRIQKWVMQRVNHYYAGLGLQWA